MDLQNKWLRECTSVAQMKETISLEQLLEMLPADMRAWVRHKKSKTCQEAGKLADEYIQTRQAVGDWDRKEPVRRCYSCDKIGHFAKDCPGITKKGGDSNPGGRTMDVVQELHPKSKISAVDSEEDNTIHLKN